MGGKIEVVLNKIVQKCSFLNNFVQKCSFLTKKMMKKPLNCHLELRGFFHHFLSKMMKNDEK